MLKIRLQGSKKDIQCFMTELISHQHIKIINIFGILTNKGTKKYIKVHVEIEKAE